MGDGGERLTARGPIVHVRVAMHNDVDRPRLPDSLAALGSGFSTHVTDKWHSERLPMACSQRRSPALTSGTA